MVLFRARPGGARPPTGGRPPSRARRATGRGPGSADANPHDGYRLVLFGGLESGEGLPGAMK
jgi:hypothetical protein